MSTWFFQNHNGFSCQPYVNSRRVFSTPWGIYFLTFVRLNLRKTPGILITNYCLACELPTLYQSCNKRWFDLFKLFLARLQWLDFYLNSRLINMMRSDNFQYLPRVNLFVARWSKGFGELLSVGRGDWSGQRVTSQIPASPCTRYTLTDPMFIESMITRVLLVLYYDLIQIFCYLI